MVTPYQVSTESSSGLILAIQSKSRDSQEIERGEVVITKEGRGGEVGEVKGSCGRKMTWR